MGNTNYLELPMGMFEIDMCKYFENNQMTDITLEIRNQEHKSKFMNTDYRIKGMANFRLTI